MFGFLKDKLKTALHKFSKDVEKDAETTVIKKEETIVDIQETEQKIQKKAVQEVHAAPISAEKEEIIWREIDNAKTIQKEVEDSSKEKLRELQSQQTSKRKEIESKKESHTKPSKEDSEKHTEYITIDSTNKQNQNNAKIEIEDEDFKEEFAEKKGFFSKLKEKFTKKKAEEKTLTEELAQKEEL